MFWCTADIGWVTGHSYITYGPLAVGATEIVFEGVPTYPNAGRFWEMLQKRKATIFYTAPTAIRSLIKASSSDQVVHSKSFDLSSLRLLGSVGEPINPEAWMWYYENVGGSRCPIADRYFLANRNRWSYDFSIARRNPNDSRFMHIAIARYSGGDCG